MKKPLKILVAANDLDLGGVQKSLIEFLKYIVKRNNTEVTLLLWKRDGLLINEVPRSVRILNLDYPPTIADILQKASLCSKVMLAGKFTLFQYYSKIIKKPWKYFGRFMQNYDIAISYTHKGYPHLVVADLIKADRKYLWFHHGSYTPNETEKRLNNKYFHLFTNIITVSDANRIMLKKIFPDLREKFSVIENITSYPDILVQSLEKCNDIIPEPSVTRFVTVSRFSPEKGIELAIEVAELLKQSGVLFKWYFVGDGESFHQIKKTVEEKNLSRQCILLGSRQNPYPIMKSANLYIQPSMVESFGIAVNEALFLQRIVVATNLPATADLLAGGKLGVLTDPKAKKLCAAIISLLHNPAHQHFIRAQLALLSFDNNHIYAKINALLDAQSIKM